MMYAKCFDVTQERDSGWIQTYTGKKFWPLDPRPEEVDIKDIAHALSLQCRFTGHLRQFYSVAQHSVMVSRLLPLELRLWGLLHDSSEAYLVDVATPVKRSPEMKPYREAEERVMAAVATAFKLGYPEPPEIKPADMILLVTEKRDLLDGEGKTQDWGRQYDDVPRLDYKITPWPPAYAEFEFLRGFTELYKP